MVKCSCPTCKGRPICTRPAQMPSREVHRYPPPHRYPVIMLTITDQHTPKAPRAIFSTAMDALKTLTSSSQTTVPMPMLHIVALPQGTDCLAGPQALLIASASAMVHVSYPSISFLDVFYSSKQAICLAEIYHIELTSDSLSTYEPYSKRICQHMHSIAAAFCCVDTIYYTSASSPAILNPNCKSKCNVDS